MKKIMILFLTAALVLSCAACGKKEETPSEEERSGAYTPADSPEITDEIRKLVEKATETMDGASYVPVAYIASQIVAGTNHLILCEVTPVVPDAKSSYVLITLYESLDGKAEITETLECAAEAPVFDEEGNVLAGGWQIPETPEMTEEAQAAFEKACETLTGGVYTPVALLATQVVAGMNYSILCSAEPSTSVENPETWYTIIHVYADLDGNAEITDTFDFGA